MLRNRMHAQDREARTGDVIDAKVLTRLPLSAKTLDFYFRTGLASRRFKSKADPRASASSHTRDPAFPSK